MAIAHVAFRVRLTKEGEIQTKHYGKHIQYKGVNSKFDCIFLLNHKHNILYGFWFVCLFSFVFWFFFVYIVCYSKC